MSETTVNTSAEVNGDSSSSSGGGGAAAGETAALPLRVEPCPNCGEELRGRYCSNCGEKSLEGVDYSLGRFLGEAFNILTNFESNVFRSFKDLLLHPGRLTAAYFRGRRKSYLKPLQLFVFCNIIFFFAQSYTGFSSLTTPLYVHLNMLPYSQQARTMVERELQERKITYDEYRPRFDAAIDGQAKTLVIVFVPLFALLLHALYWRKRRYYVEHSSLFHTLFCVFPAAPPGRAYQSDHLLAQPVCHRDQAARARTGFDRDELVAVLMRGLFVGRGRPRVRAGKADDHRQMPGHDRRHHGRRPAL
ncbi:MAG TPA: DUF3667 domain-containing protein [Pyrinomonadaceae bacterium]|jgi:hypothetical protein